MLYFSSIFNLIAWTCNVMIGKLRTGKNTVSDLPCIETGSQGHFEFLNEESPAIDKLFYEILTETVLSLVKGS
jgi:hypothetical protein